MKNLLTIVMVAVAATVLSLVLLPYVSSRESVGAGAETAYQRVERTRTIRCGYFLWPPFLAQDFATKKFSGVAFDYMTATAESLGLQVEWALEIYPGQQVETLKSGKVDAICLDGTLQTKATLYQQYIPLIYVPLYLYAKVDDTRFDGKLESANDPSVKIVTLDGDFSLEYAQKKFSRAQRLEMPHNTDPASLFTNIVSGKGDLTVNDPFSAGNFLAQNPGTIRKVAAPPLGMAPVSFSVLRGEDALANMLQQAVQTIRERGEEDKILAVYETTYPDSVVRVARLYQVR